MSSTRPIPFNTVDTLFWSYAGTAPEWFVCDEEVVSAKQFASVGSANEWMRRRQDGREMPRVLAVGDNGSLYWLTNGHHVLLNAFGNPDFSADEPCYS